MEVAKFTCEMFEFAYDASLGIQHPSITIDEISRELGITPLRAHNAGDPRHTPKRTSLPGNFPDSFWTVKLSTRDGEDLVAFLADFVAMFSPHAEFFRKIVHSNGRISCFVGVYAPRSCDHEFGWKLLEDLSRLCVDLRIDFYGSERPQKSLRLD
jgi:hypothetical protein